MSVVSHWWRSNPSDGYLPAVKALRFGKRLPDALYVHRDAFNSLPPVLREAVFEAEDIASVTMGRFDYDVIKFSRTKHSISLLSYPTFFTEGFPGLVTSWSVNLDNKTFKQMNFSASDPWILHRKEEMLPPEHKSIPGFEKLTRQAEDLGLFKQTKTIGKRSVWDGLLRKAGVQAVGNKLVEIKRANPKRAAPPVSSEYEAKKIAEAKHLVSGMKLRKTVILKDGIKLRLYTYRDGGLDIVRWILVDSRDEIIGTGNLAKDKISAMVGTAVIIKSYRRQGLYTRVLIEMRRILGVPIESDVSMTAGAIGAWKRAGGKLTDRHGDKVYRINPSVVDHWWRRPVPLATLAFVIPGIPP